MTLHSEIESDREYAEQYLGETVKTCDCSAKLIAIYSNCFETTGGLYEVVEVERGYKGVCTYTARYAEALPVEYKKLEWVFPNGTVGEVTLEVVDGGFSKRPFINSNGERFSKIVSKECI